MAGESTEEGSPAEDICFVFSFVICVIFIGAICILGLCGNLTSLFVLVKHKTETVTIFLLQSICVSDSLLLLTSIVLYCLPEAFAYARKQGYTNQDATSYMVTVWPFAMIAHTLTIWLTLLVTFTRYCAVCKPQQNFKSQNIRSTRLQVLVVFILAVLYNIPRFFEHQPIRRIHSVNHSLTGDNSSQYTEVNLGDEKLYQIIYSNVSYFLIMYIVPLSSLSFMNFRLIRSLKALREKRKSMTGRDAPNDQITLCVIITVCVFVVCQTPALINQIFWAALSVDDRECGQFHFYYTKLSDLLVVVNSACNIIIYCLCGKGFRDMFFQAICHRCIPESREPAVNGGKNDKVRQNSPTEDCPVKPDDQSDHIDANSSLLEKEDNGPNRGVDV